LDMGWMSRADWAGRLTNNRWMDEVFTQTTHHFSAQLKKENI